MTPSPVKQEVKGLGYAETAGANEELKNCCRLNADTPRTSKEIKNCCWLRQVQESQPFD